MAGGNSNPTGGGASSTTPSWAGGPVGSGSVQNIFEAPSTKQFGGQILGDARATYNQGPKVFDKSLYAGLSDTTQGGLNDILGMDTGDYSNGIAGALGYYGDTAAGNKLGVNDPGYAALRAKLQNDVSGSVNSTFTGSGRFGSGSHVGSLTDELTSSLGALDYGQYSDSLDRQTQAAGMLPGLLSAAMAPAQNKLGVGQVMDADAQAKLTGENDLFRRQNDAGMSHIAQYLNLLNGGAGENGVLTPEPNWLQSLMGFIAGNAGNAIKAAF